MCINTLLGGEKELIRFGHLDLIFKVTLALRNVLDRVSAHHLLNRTLGYRTFFLEWNNGFLPTLYNYPHAFL